MRLTQNIKAGDRVPKNDLQSKLRHLPGLKPKKCMNLSFSSPHPSSPGCLTASKCLLWNFNIHRPLRVIKGPQIYMQKQEFQQPAVLQPYLVSVSKPPFPLRLTERPAVHPGNVMSAHDLSSIQCVLLGPANGNNYSYF